MKTSLKIFVFFVTTITVFSAEEVRQDVIDVSMIRLIAAPDEYANKLVRVKGYLIIEFEENAIYLHEEDFKQMLTKNGLSVSANPEMMQKLAKISGQYVLLEGVFKPPYRGHLYVWGNAFSGSITEVRRAQKWVWNRRK